MDLVYSSESKALSTPQKKAVILEWVTAVHAKRLKDVENKLMLQGDCSELKGVNPCSSD